MKNTIENIITTFEQYCKRGKLQEFSTPGKSGNTMAKMKNQQLTQKSTEKLSEKSYIWCVS